MLHVIIERPEPSDAIVLARQLYASLSETGRHVILDTPADFRTNLPERRLSSAQVPVTARQTPPSKAIEAHAKHISITMNRP